MHDRVAAMLADLMFDPPESRPVHAGTIADCGRHSYGLPATPPAADACGGLQTGIGLSVCRKMTTAWTRIRAKTGEMSRPPMDGIVRREGRTTGAESGASGAATGEMWRPTMDGMGRRKGRSASSESVATSAVMGL